MRFYRIREHGKRGCEVHGKFWFGRMMSSGCGIYPPQGRCDSFFALPRGNGRWGRHGGDWRNPVGAREKSDGFGIKIAFSLPSNETCFDLVVQLRQWQGPGLFFDIVVEKRKRGPGSGVLGLGGTVAPDRGKSSLIQLFRVPRRSARPKAVSPLCHRTPHRIYVTDGWPGGIGKYR